MALGTGNEATAADRNIFYNRFMDMVRNAYIGSPTDFPNPYGLVIWHSASAPPYNPGSLGNRAYNPGAPATTIATNVEFTSAQIAPILNALAGFAGQMTRYRIYNYTFTVTPGPSISGSGFTAFNNAFLSAASIPIPAIPAGFAVGQEINLKPVGAADPVLDPFFNALLTSLINFRAANQVSQTFCHSSCHSSCHGARGRR